MDCTAAPQVIEHLKEQLNFTPFDTRWVPQSARYVVLGQYPRATGCIRVCQLNKGKSEKLAETEQPKGFKCGTFGASSIEDRHLATGDYAGGLAIWDLENLKKPVW
ncbi:wdr92, partial [Symbiodinium necroappetens]